ncbi:MAG: peptidylprolyl isomerase [Xanthomonadaceae bacterium]|nr:peptidylprolyl isomerase [Xanthomonadaceae bacterium]MDE2256907.1 peptidylprolyl isomerase [Xanthomonadaceae bacterium]
MEHSAQLSVAALSGRAPAPADAELRAARAVTTQAASREIAVAVIDSRESVAREARTHRHDHDDESRSGIGQPPPCCLHVGCTPIDEGQIAQEMQYHREADPRRARRAAAQALVVRELLRREAERLDIDAESECVDGETAEEAAIRILIEREMTVPVPGVEACRRYFEQNAQHLRHPDHLRLRHILLAAAPEDVATRLAARTRGEELIAALRTHPERFAEFAQRHSACPSREDGGELGWIVRGDTVPEFERQVFMLTPGLAGLTVETRYGHHVVNVDEIVHGTPLSFAEAESKIAAYLETQARQNAIQQHLCLLSERYGVRGLEHFDA